MLVFCCVFFCFFFFKQKTAYEMRISDWSSDVCSSDLLVEAQESRAPGKAQIVIQVPERLGGKVIEVENLSKAYGDKLLFEDLSFTLPPGGIVGVIGPNGAGKSTLFRLLTGQEQPDEGSITLGDTVRLGYVDQSRDALDPNRSEEHTSELQSLMRISYAVFCL